MNNGLNTRVVINDKIIENENTLEPNIQSLIIDEVTTQRNNLALGCYAINRLTSVIKNPKDLSLSGAKIKVFVKKTDEGTETAEIEPLTDDTALFIDEPYIDDDDSYDIANTVAQIKQNELKSKEIEVRQYFGYPDDYPLSDDEIAAKYDEISVGDSTESEGNPQDTVTEDSTEYSETDNTSIETPDIEIAIHDSSDSFSENFFSKVYDEDIDAESNLIEEETISDGWIPAGVFTIASAVPNEESIKITAYDNMCKLTGEYVPKSRELTNISDYYEDLRSQILSKYGIIVLDTALPEIYLTWNIVCTYRESLGYIAGLVGGIATSNRRGEIEIKTYGYTSTQIQMYDSFTETSDQMALIESISVDTVGIGNPSDYIAEGESENPIWFCDPLYGEIKPYADPDVEGGDDTEITSQTVLADVYNSLSSLNYQPCTIICDWDTGLEVTRLVKLLTPEDIEEKMKLLNSLANENDEETQNLIKTEIDALGRYICISNQTINLITGKTQITSIGENSEQLNARNFETETDKKVKNAAGKIRYMEINKADIDLANVKDASIKNAMIGDAEITSAKIADASINTAKIEDAAITSAKIGKAQITEALIADASIKSAKVDKAQILEAHIADAQIGTSKIKDASITSAKIIDASIESAKIKDGAITNAKIENAAIDTAKIKDAAITSAKIKEGEIETAHIGDAQVSTAKIADASITSAKIVEGAITGATIHDGAITNAKIADASITNAKIDSLNAEKITSGTLATERLILIDNETGKVSVITALNEQAKNMLDGAVIQEKSIEAAKIIVADLEAFKATIGGFDIDSSSIHSKKTAINDPTAGVYIGTTGIGVGDGNTHGISGSPFEVYADGTVKMRGKNGSIMFDPISGDIDIVATNFCIGTNAVVVSTQVMYQTGESGTEAPIGEWEENIPPVDDGDYLWIKTLTNYSNGVEQIDYSVSKQNGEAIMMTVTSSNGNVLRSSDDSIVLTAHVFVNGAEQDIDDNGVCRYGTVKWYLGSELKGSSRTLTVLGSRVNSPAVYTVQLE